MDKHQAAMVLLNVLGLSQEKAGMRYAMESKEILDEALDPLGALPTNWQQLSDSVRALAKNPRQMQPGNGLDLIKVIIPINVCIDHNLPFPELG